MKAILWAWRALRRDALLLARRPGEALAPFMFFIMVAAVFPLALGGSPETLRAAAPGVIWSAALLASLLAQDFLFRADEADGVLEQMALSGRPLELLALAKSVAHFCATGAPAALSAPLLGAWFSLPPEQTLRLLWALPLGAGVFSMLAVFAASLTAGGRRNNFMGALISLPLAAPAVIFGAASAEGERAPMLLLAALFAFSAAVLPVASAAALRLPRG